MGVFPAASSSHVPKPWAKLMSDPVSSFEKKKADNKIVMKFTPDIIITDNLPP